MSISSDKSVMRGESAVEALLEQASPRPAPPSEDERMVLDAVRTEWKSVTGKYRSRRRFTHFAIAATVLLAVAVSFNAFRVTGVAPVQVASIDKSHGSIYLLGDQSELQELTDLAAISAGQTIITGDESGIGLAWGNGGSLRVDQNTRIEFLSGDRVLLRSGRIYFDSQPADLTAGISAGSGDSVETVAAITGSGDNDSKLVIETEHGTVTHRGTQYITYTDAQKLSVSVREGKVEIDGRSLAEPAVALVGQQLTVSGGARPSVSNIQSYGERWEWAEAITPDVSVDGRSTYEFLQWVGRETGLAVQFETPAAEDTAREGLLYGTIDQSPASALRFRMLGEDLEWIIEGGVIKVSAINSGNGR